MDIKEKIITLIVNSREKEWDKREISYEDVIRLAFGNYSDNPNIVYTVTYMKAHSPREGSLVKGSDPIRAKEGMIFNVTQTNKS